MSAAWNTEIEVFNHAGPPALDGLWSVQRDPFEPGPEIINSSQRGVQIYAQNTQPTSSGWWENRVLAWFPTDGLEVLDVVGFRWQIQSLTRHLADPGMQVVPALYEGHAPNYNADPATGIIDVVDVNSAASWYDLGGKQGIGPPLTFDAINQLIAENGGGSSTTNSVGFSDATMEAGGGITVQLIGADSGRILDAIAGYDGAGFGVILAMATSAPGTLDTAHYPDAGIDPANRVRIWNGWALVMAGGGLVEIAVTGSLQLSGAAVLARQPIEPLYHRLRQRRGY